MAGLSLVVAVMLHRLASRTGLEGPAWAGAGFYFLALSGALGVAMALAASPRLAASLYTANAASAAVALALVAAAPRGEEGPGAVAAWVIGVAALAPGSLDAAAGAAGAIAAWRSRGAARLGLALLSAAHAVRALAVILAPTRGSLLVPLTIAEAVRATAAAVMLGYYAAGALRGG